MNEIYIAKSGKTTGPFSQDQIRSMVASGMIAPSDIAWQSGLVSWVRIDQLLQVIPPAPMVPPPPPPPVGASPITSKSAIASLVCAIFGSVLGLPALAGLGLGIYALISINKSGGKLRGTVLAVGGIICSVAAFFVFGTILAARHAAQKEQCISQLRSIEGITGRYMIDRKIWEHPSFSDPVFLSYLKDGQLPQCPSGGTYIEGKSFGYKPQCSVHGYSP